MKEIPILFSGEMVSAILEGRKTQTRRVIKGTNLCVVERWISPPSFGQIWDGYHGPTICAQRKCPYGQVGDLLYVRETWNIAPLAIHYRADNSFVSFPDEPRLNDYRSTPGWRPSIHMPRWASRLDLRIVSLKAERLQDITYMDALAEGCPEEHLHFRIPGLSSPKGPVAWFADLWDRINARRGYP